jgi:FKBP-type peptidyl-prolyl cis-trans isomerase SlyD
MSNESEAESDEEQTQGEEEPTGLQDDDFVKVEYTARTVEDDRLVDTTSQEVADEEGIDEEGRDFEPRTIVLGQGHIFESVEDDIRGSEVGDSGAVTVPATEAFGEFDEDEVRTISKDKIPEDDRYPGGQVTIEGDEGFIETIIGGRARVDFNHPLAGDDIEYEYEVVDTIDDREKKAHSLLDTLLGLDLDLWFETDTVEEEQLVEDEGEDDDTEDEDDAEAEGGDEADEADEPEYETVEVEKESLYIEATPQLTMNQQWMMQKQQIGNDLIDLLGIDRIVIQEIIEGNPMGMPGMMGGMGGGMGGGDLEEALEDADIDADELADEL